MTEIAPPHDHKPGCLYCEFPPERVQDLRVPSFYGSFDIFPASPGHLEVIPNRHIVTIAEFTKSEWNELQSAIKNGIDLIETTDVTIIYQREIQKPYNNESAWFSQRALEHPKINTRPDAYNHGVNDGPAAGRTINHFHWHIIPRYEGDVEDPKGGVRYAIPEHGNYTSPRIKLTSK